MLDDQAGPPVTPVQLLGRWLLARDVDDRLGPPRTVTGTLGLTRVDDDRIAWHEAGTMTWQGQTAEVTRDLLLSRRDRDGWTVCFADGRDFHAWRPGERVHHPCGSDDYRGLVEVVVRDGVGAVTEWTVRWDVLGPAKNYTMTTRLTRIDDLGTIPT